MSKNDSPTLPGILYVDDETQALKYFAMAFKKNYRVFTADNGKTGLEILDAHHSEISIIVSDQRMPEMTGVDFLSQVRTRHPSKVRILTTAYSDLESAIRSVNEGKIYQYVTKPWDLQDFKMVLKRAYDYHSILSERDQLMRLKMSTLQRIILADRLKTLTGVAHSGCIKETALFIDTLLGIIQGLPHSFDLNPASGGAAMLQHGLAKFIKQERSANAEILKAWQSADFELETRIAALNTATKDTDASQTIQLTIEQNSDSLTIHCSIGDHTPQQVLNQCLGILCEAEPSPLALNFFQLLAAARNAGKSVTLCPKAGAEDSDLLSISAQSNEDAEHLEEILAKLYDRWDSANLGF
ncbi:response regulator [Coraliomargarita sp. SDUM461004]|uniref:Response regulator n=1 Tax=Thalassobacterium sedimentorum TaxID=3041258 RepID=A0ABU1AIW0_9BACT|nr:response regulator [Coraliomargarita sp. SDUM461004]MDQ8194088.1 response regulator [Coraliomargarita sp. SDUM461004]